MFKPFKPGSLIFILDLDCLHSTEFKDINNILNNVILFWHMQISIFLFPI